MTSTLLGVRASTGTVPHSAESMADDAYAFITKNAKMRAVPRWFGWVSRVVTL